MHSAIYQGSVRHRRFLPKRHEFGYSSTLFYIDLDELPNLFKGVAGWSVNRVNAGSFRRADFLGDPAVPLKDAVRIEVNKLLASNNNEGIGCPDGAVRMLTNLRIFGFCFNPVTFYYLFNVDAEKPAMILAQVNNTPWDERHSYLIHCDEKTGKANSQFDKKFHVSPFNPLAMEYHWVSSAPAENLLVHMENYMPPQAPVDAIGKPPCCHMDATLTLRRHPWSASLLQKLLWLQPWAAIKVPVAIYWQAVRLFVKGVPVYAHQSENPLPTASSVELKTTGE
jgi:DUF1365 family protein